MDHGGEAARPTTVVSTDHGMAIAVQEGEAYMSTGTFHGQLGPAGVSFEPTASAHHNSAVFARHVRAASGGPPVPVAVFHREPGPGVLYANIAVSWRQPSPGNEVLVGLQLPGGVVPVHVDSRPSAGRGVVLAALLSYGGGGAVYNRDYAMQPRSGAGQGEVLVDLLPDDVGHGEAFVSQLLGGGGGGGAMYSGDYALQLRPGAGHGEVLVDLLSDDAGHDEAFVGHLPGGGVAAYDDHGYYALQPRPGTGHDEVLVDLLSDGSGHGEMLVSLLPDGGVYDDYGYYAWQPRLGAGQGEVFIGPLPDGVGAVFDNSGNFAQQTVPSNGHADGITEHLRRLLPFAGIGACSVAVNGLAAGPGSPAVPFDLFAMFLGGLFLVMLHVLRV